MSKVGRKPISVSGLTVDIKGQDIHYKGAKASGVYSLASELQAHVDEGSLYIAPSKNNGSKLSARAESNMNRLWGLNRALVANALGGALQEFEKVIEINGLGYKAVLAGKKMIFSLGYTHEIEKEIPADITVEIDKSGQKVRVKSVDKMLLGQFCSEVRRLRPPEPYKGKGIKLQTEVLFRKSAGKGKK
jgi:large subunit ribosomal protein L6